MKLDNIREFIQLAKDEGVSELKYEEKDFKIRVSFANTFQQIPMSYPAHTIGTSSFVAPTVLDKDANIFEITSPFVGTFYSTPAPGKPSYVKVGDTISKGQTLCILEAMKIMNEIESEVSGEVVEICIENENLVEFGQPLFKIRV